MQRSASWGLFILSLVCAVGCGSDSGKPQSGAPVVETGSEEGDPAIREALAKLSAEDRELAEKQKICPVGGGALGSMGAPIKVTVQERTVFLCCEGCKGAIESDPDKFLAKLDAGPDAEASPH